MSIVHGLDSGMESLNLSSASIIDSLDLLVLCLVEKYKISLLVLLKCLDLVGGLLSIVEDSLLGSLILMAHFLVQRVVVGLEDGDLVCQWLVSCFEVVLVDLSQGVELSNL